MNIPLRLLAASWALATTASLALSAIPIAPVPPQATLRAATVQVRVAPDHRDWTYQVGEPARFKITVTADNEPIDG
ncbi:MAG TPA: acetylxylan esterase, partial [Opitutaceae bacterium]|nr:acetylxylan esterase [Opitutaceae bacterium]